MMAATDVLRDALERDGAQVRVLPGSYDLLQTTSCDSLTRSLLYLQSALHIDAASQQLIIQRWDGVTFWRKIRY